tara:strand:- start:1302 stop:1760 length:459 start_codon:yes stop_codon:yes gene_type:complete
MIEKIIKLYLTGLCIGNLKYAPGTFGTMLAIPIYILIANNNINFNIIFILILTLLSIFILKLSYKKLIYRNNDDKSIVIDEIIGYLSFMIFFEPTFNNIIFGFFIFRFFDIIKPFPISIIDKNIKNSLGIILDDIVAGLFSGISLYFLLYAF